MDLMNQVWCCRNYGYYGQCRVETMVEDIIFKKRAHFGQGMVCVVLCRFQCMASVRPSHFGDSLWSIAGIVLIPGLLFLIGHWFVDGRQLHGGIPLVDRTPSTKTEIWTETHPIWGDVAWETVEAEHMCDEGTSGVHGGGKMCIGTDVCRLYQLIHYCQYDMASLRVW